MSTPFECLLWLSPTTAATYPTARPTPFLWYCQLSHLGFRRSGNHYYRPQCPSCDECKSCRIRVFEINLNSKRFKRILAKSNNLQISLSPATYSAEHYELYQKYIRARHQDGDMYPPTVEQYKSFIVGAAPNSSR